MIAYGRRPKWNQRESAYVSRKRTWRTLSEPSSIYNLTINTSKQNIVEDMDIATANIEEDSAVPKAATEAATSVI